MQKRHGGRPRRALTGALSCGRCSAALVARPRVEHGSQLVANGRYVPTIEHVARYVCPSCRRLAILAEPTERIIAAAVAMRGPVASVTILPARPGQNAYTAERLRVIWPDGSTTTGGPLTGRSPVPAPCLVGLPRREAQAAWWRWNSEGWQAVYEQTGAALAGSTHERTEHVR
jgi:hypothetical protein